MAISNDFHFNQASLQDFQDCKRRYFYRYIQKLSWPALEVEPALANEQWMQQGAEFHQFVRQYFLGFPEELLSGMMLSDNLKSWWESFLTYMPVDLALPRFPEVLLATQIAGNMLTAKYDLVVVDQENTMTIYDWKTSRRRSSHAYLEDRMQSKVYPYVLSKSGKFLKNGLEVDPNMINMIYWYPNNPEEPEVFRYSTAKMDQDEKEIESLIMEIVYSNTISEYPMTDDPNRCRYCVYRSLCDRGEYAGQFEELVDEITPGLEETIDFDQIPEIEF